jgi:hypothetical protein
LWALDKWFDVGETEFSTWLGSRKQVAPPVAVPTDAVIADEEETSSSDENSTEGETVTQPDRLAFQPNEHEFALSYG